MLHAWHRATLKSFALLVSDLCSINKSWIVQIKSIEFPFEFIAIYGQVPFCMHGHQLRGTDSNRHSHGHQGSLGRLPFWFALVLPYPRACDRNSCPWLCHRGIQHTVSHRHSPRTVHCLSTMQQRLYSLMMIPVLRKANHNNVIIFFSRTQNDRPKSWYS